MPQNLKVKAAMFFAARIQRRCLIFYFSETKFLNFNGEEIEWCEAGSCDMLVPREVA